MAGTIINRFFNNYKTYNRIITSVDLILHKYFIMKLFCIKI